MEGWGSAYIGTYTVTVWPNCETTGTDASSLKMLVRTARDSVLILILQRLRICIRIFKY